MGTTTAFATLATSRMTSRTLNRWLTHGSIVLADLIAVMAAGAVAVITRYIFHGKFLPGDYFSFVPAILIFLAVFAFSGLYPGIATSPIDEFRLILRGSSISFLILSETTYLLREGIMSSRIVILLAWFLTIIYVPFCRRMMRGWCSRQGWWGIPTVILGEAAAGKRMLDLLEGHRRVGLRPVALLVEDRLTPSSEAVLPSNVFYGDISLAQDFSRDYRDYYAVLAMPNSGGEHIKNVFNKHAEQYRHVLIIPDLAGMRTLSVTAKDICGVLGLEVEQKLTLVIPQLIKRGFDLTLSLAAGILIGPLVLLLCILVKVTSPGPIFYGQQRIGRGNKTFKLWKLRSMVVNADEFLKEHLQADEALRLEWNQDQKLKRDPRVTWIGRILRKTSLDELPQLWNVICGDMSLVGPRPIVESEVVKYGAFFAQYKRVTPGVTGLWQISGRNNTTYELRTQIDDYYVRNWSLSMDIYILMRTLKTVFLSEGAY